MPLSASRSVDRSVAIRRIAIVATLLAAVAAVLAVLTSGGQRERKLVPGAGRNEDSFDPLAFREGMSASFERRAAAGMAHVLYAKSPGGAAATARRAAVWRPQVESAARRFRLDPDMLEAIVFLESAGRPNALAGHHLEAAAGLTQILAETAVNLLDMRVDLSASRRLTRRIARAAGRGDRRAIRRLLAARRRADERFDPAKALAGTGRYLSLARARFGRDDLAVASYHMGIGNLEGALRSFAGEQADPIEEVVESNGLTYARLYFDSTPLLHSDAHQRLARLGDDSSTYFWRVLAARQILRLYRQAPAELDRLERLHAAKGSSEEVLHPPGSTPILDGPGELERARRDRRLIALPPSLGAGSIAVDPRLGEFAGRVGRKPALYRALRPEALAILLYIGTGVRAVSGDAPLSVTSAVRDRAYQRLLVERNGEATRGYSLHTTGYAFDILRSYRSRRQARAFQFWLDRLQAMNLIAWVREPTAIHITVSKDARRLGDALVKDDAERFVEEMRPFAALGVKTVVVMPLVEEPVAFVERLGADVVPALAEL